MRQARVMPGYYHYVHPQPGRSAKDECHHFFNYVNSRGGWDQPIIMPPWVDVEWQQRMGQRALASWVKDFCVELERLLKGKISKARRDDDAVDPRSRRVGARHLHGRLVLEPAAWRSKGLREVPAVLQLLHIVGAHAAVTPAFVAEEGPHLAPAHVQGFSSRCPWRL
jgi:hypothetical protein